VQLAHAPRCEALVEHGPEPAALRRGALAHRVTRSGGRSCASAILMAIVIRPGSVASYSRSRSDSSLIDAGGYEDDGRRDGRRADR
jgi:hypothetical protein